MLCLDSVVYVYYIWVQLTCGTRVFAIGQDAATSDRHQNGGFSVLSPVPPVNTAQVVTISSTFAVLSPKLHAGSYIATNLISLWLYSSGILYALYMQPNGIAPIMDCVPKSVSSAYTYHQTQDAQSPLIHYNGCVLVKFINKCGTLSQEPGYPVHNLPQLNPNVTALPMICQLHYIGSTGSKYYPLARDA